MTDRLRNANYIKAMTANFSLFFAFFVLTPLPPALEASLLFRRHPSVLHQAQTH